MISELGLGSTPTEVTDHQAVYQRTVLDNNFVR